MHSYVDYLWRYEWNFRREALPIWAIISCATIGLVYTCIHCILAPISCSCVKVKISMEFTSCFSPVEFDGSRTCVCFLYKLSVDLSVPFDAFFIRLTGNTGIARSRVCDTSLTCTLSENSENSCSRNAKVAEHSVYGHNMRWLLRLFWVFFFLQLCK